MLLYCSMTSFVWIPSGPASVWFRFTVQVFVAVGALPWIVWNTDFVSFARFLPRVCLLVVVVYVFRCYVGASSNLVVGCSFILVETEINTFSSKIYLVLEVTVGVTGTRFSFQCWESNNLNVITRVIFIQFWGGSHPIGPIRVMAILILVDLFCTEVHPSLTVQLAIPIQP